MALQNYVATGSTDADLVHKLVLLHTFITDSSNFS